MSRIDLSGLPAPDILAPVDFEAMLATVKADMISRDPSLADALNLESDPLTKLSETLAYFVMTTNSHINHTAKAMLLAYATGTTLDHLGAWVNVKRLLVKEGNPQAVPPIPDEYESDEDDCSPRSKRSEKDKPYKKAVKFSYAFGRARSGIVVESPSVPGVQ